jgi:signal transduction histidine kinase
MPPGAGPPFAAPPGTGERFGLAALAERLVPFDGALDVGVNEDGGVTVAVRIPRAGRNGR